MRSMWPSSRKRQRGRALLTSAIASDIYTMHSGGTPMRKIAGLALVLWFAQPDPALSQGGRGAILGTVTDTSGAAVPNVSVSIVHTGTQQKRTIVTDERGGFQVTALDVG